MLVEMDYNAPLPIGPPPWRRWARIVPAAFLFLMWVAQCLLFVRVSNQRDVAIRQRDMFFDDYIRAVDLMKTLEVTVCTTK